ncbi:MAG: leucyl/phenylalanyl-tRNA--protein transferase [Gammaproteobacteria bacterium]|nr:leucyl/phenylalanyl-tRNA--protein transferase [Gammaproteobacteria bacterium]
MFILAPDHFTFPPAELASPEGLLAIGGDLQTGRLLEAYGHGIFPWYNNDQPILWWSPDPRATLFPDQLRISKSLKKTLRKQKFRVSFDHAFEQVIRACAASRAGRRRPEQEAGDATDPGTWILPEMIEAYCILHEQGYAHSVETWLDDKLVGGLYGVSLGRAFFGESMFSRETDASKVALVFLAEQLKQWRFELIDCQVSSPHLQTLGAVDLRREDFMTHLSRALAGPDQPGSWAGARPCSPWFIDGEVP